MKVKYRTWDSASCAEILLAEPLGEEVKRNELLAMSITTLLVCAVDLWAHLIEPKPLIRFAAPAGDVGPVNVIDPRLTVQHWDFVDEGTRYCVRLLPVVSVQEAAPKVVECPLLLCSLSSAHRKRAIARCLAVEISPSTIDDALVKLRLRVRAMRLWECCTLLRYRFTDRLSAIANALRWFA